MKHRSAYGSKLEAWGLKNGIEIVYFKPHGGGVITAGKPASTGTSPVVPHSTPPAKTLSFKETLRRDFIKSMRGDLDPRSLPCDPALFPFRVGDRVETVWRDTWLPGVVEAVSVVKHSSAEHVSTLVF